MKDANRPRFDIDALRGRVGERTFARGEAYHRGGQVTILSVEPKRVLAQVLGSEEYRTVLTGRGKAIGGDCSCPAFGDWGFCKHMVAAALAANEIGQDDTEAAGALPRIRAHLKGRGVDALVQMIIDLAECDTALFRRLDMASATEQGDEKAVAARLRKAIDGATRTNGSIEYGETAGWAEGVHAVLDILNDLSSGPLAAELAEHAIDRIESALEGIDDSDGHCGDLLKRAAEIHIAATIRAKPDPGALARELFTREMEDGYGVFDGASGTYAEALGDEGLAGYRRLAAEAWEKLPALSSGRGKHDSPSEDYRRLIAILDGFTEREGDVDARIALRAKDLSSSWNYLQLVEFCLSQARAEEALKWAEEGLWVFEDERPNERLLRLASELLLKAGRGDDAAKGLWRAFEKEPSFELFKQLRAHGGTTIRDRAIELLKARVAEKKLIRWNRPVDLLLRILIHEEMFDSAWNVAYKQDASITQKEALARASEEIHPREALEVYAERVRQLAQAGTGSDYAEAAKLVARMAGLWSAAEQAAYVGQLKERFGRRRNLMKLLG